MDIKSIKNERVLLKVDFNIPENLLSNERILASLETIKILLKGQNKIVLLTHFGRPEKGDKEKFSTEKLLDLIKKTLEDNFVKCNIEYANQYESFDEVGKQILNSNSQLFILENTRFSPDEGDKDEFKRLALAEKYAILGDVFVDEAFSLSHRKEATNFELKKLFQDKEKSFYGLNYLTEIENLKKLKEPKIQFLTVIMGGAKMETKLPLIEKTLEKSEYVIVAGLLAFTFLEARKNLFGDSYEIYDSKKFVEVDFVEEAKRVLKKYPGKIILPEDFVFFQDGAKKYAYDVGQKSLDKFKQKLELSDGIFWNGTLGYYELKPYDKGTLEIAEYLSNSNKIVIIGGGDTVASIDKKYSDKFTFVSTGGGASLDFISKF